MIAAATDTAHTICKVAVHVDEGFEIGFTGRRKIATPLAAYIEIYMRVAYITYLALLAESSYTFGEWDYPGTAVINSSFIKKISVF